MIAQRGFCILFFHTLSLQLFANSITHTPTLFCSETLSLCAGEGRKGHRVPIQYNETICWHLLTAIQQTDKASEKFSEENLDLNLSPDTYEI